MAQDDTQIFVPAELKGPENPPLSGSSDGGHVESYVFHRHLSGRFWIAMILAIGVVGITALVLSGAVKLESNAAIAVYTAFSAGALSNVSTYMGQNSKPSEKKDNEKV
jgi:hypothetical protein